MWDKFLKRVWGNKEGWAYLAYKGSGYPWRQKTYRYPEELDKLIEDAKKHNKYANIYFCPHLFTSAANKKGENAAPLKALWIDQDSGDYKDIQPKPTCLWRTSEGKHQALWILKDYVDPQEAEVVVRYLTYKIPGADKGTWNLGRVIRFPESINYKYTPPHQGSVIWTDGPEYTLKELEPKEGERRKESLDSLMQNTAAPKMPRHLPTFQEAIISFGPRIPAAVWGLLEQKPQPGDEWSENLWKMERLLMEAGVPLEQAFAIVWDSPWNKYKRDNRPKSHLWHELYKAQQEKGPLQDSPNDFPWVSVDELMLYSERPEWMVEGFWMDKNVGWIAGVGKSYKTVLSMDLALSIASGKPFLGKYKVNEPGPVLMVQEEDPVWRVAHRIQVMSKQKGISNLELSENGRSLVLRVKASKIPLFVSIGGGLLFDDKDKMELLENAIEQHRPKMVIIDPLFMVAAGLDEYKAGEMAEALNRIKYWRNKYGCAVALVHHFRKSTGSPIERLYGSQALYAWSENNLFVSRSDSEDTVILERDIKDARRSDEKVSVVFDDIDESYAFTVVDYKPSAVGASSREKVITFLRSGTPGVAVPKKSVIQATGLDKTTVSKNLYNLEEAGKITVDYKGVGGAMTVTPVDKLWLEGADGL